MISSSFTQIGFEVHISKKFNVFAFILLSAVSKFKYQQRMCTKNFPSIFSNQSINLSLAYEILLL